MEGLPNAKDRALSEKQHNSNVSEDPKTGKEAMHAAPEKLVGGSVKKGQQEAEVAAMHDLDLAIMMGGPRFQPYAHRLIQSIQGQRSTGKNRIVLEQGDKSIIMLTLVFARVVFNIGLHYAKINGQIHILSLDYL